MTGENFDKWWASLSTERWGYLTLRRLAIECNPRVLWTEPVDRAWEILFKNEILERKATVDVCNERFLNFNIVEKVTRYDTVFVKSPMGSGKSRSLKKLFDCKDEHFDKYKHVIYMSPKRAFASAMAAEFKEQKFVNYMDRTARLNNKVERLICSLESLHKVVEKRNEHLLKPDLLIIDESESVFNVISSQTLLENEPVKNLKTFTNLMRDARKVIVMDAHMTDRYV